MTDNFYDLFDYCVKKYEQNVLKKERLLKNRNAREKKHLFRVITRNAFETIKNSVDEGKDYAVIYESEYNKLIEELLESFYLHFKPFNVLYKKKNTQERGIIEVIKDESNYELIIDWNINKTNSNNTISSTPLNSSESCDFIEKNNEEEIIDKFGFEKIF